MATVSGKWSTPKRCNCKDADGKELGRTCPKLSGRHHGTVGCTTRIPTTSGVRELSRFGFSTKNEAGKAATQVWDLIKLGGADVATQQRIGDLIFRATARGGQLPSVEDVRRRLGLRRELDASETFGEAWAAWLAGRRKARDSYANTLEQHGRNWLLPVLKDVADADVDTARAAVTVNVALVQVGGRLVPLPARSAQGARGRSREGCRPASQAQGRAGDRIMTGCVRSASVPAAPNAPIWSGRTRSCWSERRAWDSNPRGRCRPNGFQDHRHRPLGEPSCASQPTVTTVATSAGAARRARRPRSRPAPGTPRPSRR
jgi:hypothetical protein